jgi:membrane protein DedA with SNARE-associated domain
VTEWVQELLGEGSYLVLTALLVLENVFPPIPSEVVLPFAGALVADGGLGFVGAVLAATLGSVVGALILYAIGRYGGRPLLYRHRRILRLTEAQLDRADAWFDRRGPWIVLFGRLVPGVRSVVSVPAGASEMPLTPFVALTALGSAVWNTALIGAGWSLGRNWEEASAVVESAQTIVIVAVVLASAAGAFWLLRHRRARARARTVEAP